MLSFVVLPLALTYLIVQSLTDDDDPPDTGPDADQDGIPDAADSIIRTADGTLIKTGASGDLFGSTGDDRITVTADLEGEERTYFPQFSYVDWETDTGAPALTVHGNAGDDELILSGSGYVATGGLGADTIRINGLHSAVVQAGPGDILYGQDAEDVLPGKPAPFLELTGSATLRGGSSDEEVMLKGNDAIADGGAGDDTLRAFDGRSTLLGGEGDDWLEGDATAGKYSASQQTFLRDYLGPPGDSLDGGLGDDTLSGGRGDTLTGGSGEDALSLYFDPDVRGPGAVITDFQPGTDQVTIYFDGFNDLTQGFTLQDRITSTLSPDGWVEVRGDGQLLVTLQGQTSARIAWAVDEFSGPFTALDGTTVQKGDFDVLVTAFYETIT